MLCDSFINAFVTPADQNDLTRFRKSQGFSLIKPASRRAQHHDFRCFIRPYRFDGSEYRFRLEHHAITTAEWPIIHRLMPVVREPSQVVDPGFNGSAGTP